MTAKTIGVIQRAMVHMDIDWFLIVLNDGDISNYLYQVEYLSIRIS